MQNRMRRALACALATLLAITVVAFAPAASAFAAVTPPPVDLAALAGTATTNAFRAGLGLPAMATNAALAAAAKSHSQYILNHNVIGHYENTSDSDSTGNTPADRATHFGYSDWAGEVLNQVYTPLTTGNSAQIWIDTLYHRIPFLDARIHAEGFGLAAGANNAYAGTEDFGALDWNYSFGKPVVYPQNGQSMVPTAWNALESPNPLRLFAGALDDKGNPKGPTGPVLTASFFDGDVRSASVSSSSLAGADGSTPDYYTLSSTNDDELRETVSLIPKAPLKPDTVYTVHIAGTYSKGWAGTKKPFDVTWSFRTSEAGTVSEGKMGGTWDATKGAYSWNLTINGTSLASAVKAYVGGLPYAVQHQSDGSLLVKLGSNYSLASRATIDVQWPDGSLASGDFYYSVDSARQIKPKTAAATLTIDGQQRAVQSATYGAYAWTETDAGLLPDAQFQNIGDVHILKYGNHIVEWAGSSRAAYVDGTLSTLPYAPVTLSGINYLPASWLDALLQQWTGSGSNAGGSQDGTTVGSDNNGSSDGTPGGTAGTPASVTFRDVVTHWAKEAILRLASLGIVAGNGDGTFAPDAQLTRAEFVKMLINARGIKAQPGDSGGFLDTASHWVAQQGYLGAAVTAGIVQPGEYAGDRFYPDRAITRDEMAIFIVRALGLEAEAQSAQMTVVGGRAAIDGSQFSDAGQWVHAGYIVTAIHSGIIRGYAEADGSMTFRPTDNATRAEAATMIVRMLDAAN